MTSTDLIDFLDEFRHEDTWDPALILCLACASIYVPVKQQEAYACPECGQAANEEQYRKLFIYASNAVRYGFQYHGFYSRQQEEQRLGCIKPALADLGDVYKFVALAIVSGVIGGASWDLTKSAIRKLLERMEASGPSLKRAQRVEPTINEEELQRLMEGISGYMDGLSHAEEAVRPLIYEEMWADSVHKHMSELREIARYMEKPKKKRKHNKRAGKLQKRLLGEVLAENLKVPEEAPVKNVWSKLER